MIRHPFKVVFLVFKVKGDPFKVKFYHFKMAGDPFKVTLKGIKFYWQA